MYSPLDAKKKISLITPIRGQHDLFDNLMGTLLKNTANIDDIELLLAVDADDMATAQFLDKWYFKHLVALKYFAVDRSEHFTKDYVNFLAKEAQGRFVMNINVDSEFVTPGWDELIYKGMDAACTISGDEVWLGLVNDGLDRTNEDPLFPNFSCWPIVSKKTVDQLGYFLDERFKIWGPDHFIRMIYHKINRLVSLTHVKIDHNSIHSGRRKDDGNYSRFHQIDHNNPFVITEEIIVDSVNQLKRCIHEQHNQRS